MNQNADNETVQAQIEKDREQIQKWSEESKKYHDEIKNHELFQTIKNHIFLREGSDDECQSCGFPIRFHNYKFILNRILKMLEGCDTTAYNDQESKFLKDQLYKLIKNDN